MRIHGKILQSNDQCRTFGPHYRHARGGASDRLLVPKALGSMMRTLRQVFMRENRRFAL